MDVGLLVEGHIVVDDMGDAIDIKSPGRHIRSHQNIQAAAFQIVDGADTCFLVHVAIEGGGFQANLTQLLRDGGVVATTVTQADGTYAFADVLPGAYEVAVDASTLPAGSTWTLTTAALPHALTLAEGASEQVPDIGYVEHGTIAGLVFDDADGDGTRDAGEPGISGVSVVVRRDGTDVGTVVTGADGTFTISRPSTTRSPVSMAPR